MNEYRIPTLDSQTVRKRLLAMGVGALCVFGINTHDVTHAQSEQAPYLYETEFNCDPVNENQIKSVAEARAEACIEDRTGRVALVAYDLSELDAKVIAQETEKFLRAGSDGLIDVDVVPVMANLEARKQFHDANLPCADDQTLETSGAMIADTTMNLRAEGFDRVVGISPFPACHLNVLGNASPKHGWRYANVYGHNEDIERVARVTTHEIAHGFTVNHEGGIDSDVNKKNGLSGLFADKRRFLPADNSINFDKMFQDGVFGEYSGEANIMGESDSKDNHLNSFQRYLLTWPERVKGEQPDNQVLVDTDGLTAFIPYAKRRDHQFATIFLDKAAIFYMQIDGKNESHWFDKMIIDPVFSDEIAGGESVNMVNVFLASTKDGSTASLGVMDLGDPSIAERTLEIGRNTIIVKGHNDKGVAVTRLPRR